MDSRSGIEPGDDLSRWVGHHADRSPNKVALRFEGAEITYAAFDEHVRRLAATLHDQSGVQRGDRVAHLGFNGPAVLELLFACARLGAIFAPLNWRLASAEHRMILLDCAPRVVVVDLQFRPAVENIASALGSMAIVGEEDLLAAATTADPPAAS